MTIEPDGRIGLTDGDDAAHIARTAPRRCARSRRARDLAHLDEFVIADRQR